MQDTPSTHDSMTRIITHELGHGLIEVALLLDGTILDQYKAQVGWTPNNQLFDIGDTQVQAAIANGQAPPASQRINSRNWNDLWQEQPISAYMTTSPSEDFPEAVMAYIETPNVLLARSPRRFNFIAEHIDTWRQHLTPAQSQAGDYPLPSGDTRRA